MVQVTYPFSWYFGKSIEISLPLFSMLGNVEGNIFNTTLQSPLLTVKLVSQQVKTEGKRGSNYRVQKSFINFNIVKNIFL